MGAFLFVLCAQPETFMGGTGNIQHFLKGYFDFEEARESVVN